jgi:hypothetical protein
LEKQMLGQTASHLVDLSHIEAKASGEKDKLSNMASCRAYLDMRLALTTPSQGAIPVDYDAFAQANLDELLASLAV